MIKSSWALLFFGLIGIHSLTAAPAAAQTSQNGPYYASPSWDQILPASTRFIVLSNFNNAAVLDRETGLVWERAPAGSGTWFTAMTKCHQELALANRFGWRLPSIEELSSLIDDGSVTGLPAGNPFQASINNLDEFWSSTTHETDATAADTIFFSGTLSSPNVRGKSLGGGRIWCVRGGSSVQNPQ